MNTNTPAAAPQTNLTLREAVVQAVNELKGTVTHGFSAHDVTNTIRESVNAGEYALPGFEAVPPAADGTIKYWVNHEQVKTVIDELLADGELRNLGLTNVADPTNARPYRLFEFGTATPAPVAPTTPTANANVTQGALATRVQAYLNRREGVVTTLRQVQSALKTNGVTCEDLYNLITALGINVEPGTADAFSTYTV